jgi:lysophospholipase L1-like esterase
VTGYDPRGGAYVGGDDFGLPASAPPEMTAAEAEVLVRFEHPAKLLSVAELPGAAALGDAALAQAYRLPAATLRELRSAFRRRVRTAARDLLRDPDLVEAARRLPVRPGGTVVALGDSITDDYLSWAQILRECVEVIRGEDAIAVVNAGVSGDTTADAFRRLDGVVRLAPDLVITMLGTNDCQRHGPDLQLLVAPAETARNLAGIAAWLRAAGAACAWITPPPVLEDALAAAVGARPFAVRDEDVRAVGRVLRRLGGPVVDLHNVLDGSGLLMDDGVHPSFAGQRAIAAAVLSALAGAISAPSQNQSGVGKP